MLYSQLLNGSGSNGFGLPSSAELNQLSMQAALNSANGAPGI
jgi:hypothetical protein